MTLTMEFECKLAHCDERKRIKDFSSAKELYAKVSQAFCVPINEIVYCTLNTHNFRDMNALLGNYLSHGDLIVVHMCGQVKDVTVKKANEFLGLTITDNANGRAFIKKVKSEDKNVEDNIKAGDHIAAINGESTVGLRHYEVAKAIRLLPKNTNFNMRLIEPKHSDRLPFMETSERLQDISSIHYDGNFSSSQSNLDIKSTPRHELYGVVSLSSTCDDLINSSLPIDKLLSKGDQHNSDNSSHRADRQDRYKITIERINSLLESFLGINDNLLAIQIYRLAKENRDSYSNFSSAFKASELGVFNFDEEMKSHLWRCTRELAVI